MKQRTKVTIASVLATLLVGCGGSDSSGNSTSSGGAGQTATSTAQFIDNYVEGLRYINGSNSGFTNADGEFSYTDGNISFYLGDMLLGTIEASNVPSDSKLFVQDLVGVDRNETSNAAVLKMATLLQTLDADPSTDTIEINATARAAFDTNTTLANFPDVNITNAYTGLGITRAMKSVEVQAHLEDMRKKHGEVSDTTTPSVVSNASYTNVDLDDELCIEFSERIPKDMITSSNFTVNPTIAGTLDRDNTEVCFTPDANLTAGQTYTITADGGVTDYAGNALGADQSVSYTTTAPAAPVVNIVVGGGTTQSVVEGDLSGVNLRGTTPSTYYYDYVVLNSALQQVYGLNQTTPITTITTFTTGQANSIPAGDYRIMISIYDDSSASNRVATQDVNLTVTAQNTQPTPSTDAFVVEVNTTGLADPLNFIVENASYNSSLNIDCNNDGTVEIADASHGYHACTYPSEGVYEVAISSQDNDVRIRFDTNSSYNQGDNKRKVREILQWGTIAWGDMSAMFAQSYNLTGIAQGAGAPDLSAVTSLLNMFTQARKFNADLSSWDTSNVQDFAAVFNEAVAFNGDVTTWDTSRGIRMFNMFKEAESFNQDISGWDVSGVTDTQGMHAMFLGATSFNQDINAWDISNVTTMFAMFEGATSFNQDLTVLATKKNASLNTGGMFNNSGMSQANIDTFIPPAAAPLNADIFSNRNYCNPSSQTESFIDFSANNSTGNIQSYTWTDGSQTSTGATFSYFCGGNPGTRTMTLTVEDDTGATDTISAQFTVYYQ